MKEHPVTHIDTFMSHLWIGELTSARYKYKITSSVTLTDTDVPGDKTVLNSLTLLTH